MMKIGEERNPEDILKEEFLQERAAVLGRAGEKVSIALENLGEIEKSIEEKLVLFNQIIARCQTECDEGTVRSLIRLRARDINVEIGRYNRAREYAKLRYYYLVVTREAMGMNRHHWIEDAYRIPPRKQYVRYE
jgi:hypothetical protein